MKSTYYLIALAILSMDLASAQVAYEPDASSKLIVNGTSTLHDWTSETNTVNGTFVFKSSILDRKLPSSGSIVESVRMTIPVTSLYSERGDAMNNKTHNAFKYETNPDITFIVNSDQITNVTKEGKMELKVNGVLTMAGHSENVSINLSGERLDKNQLHFTGSYPIDMLTYEMEPPSAMFGQIKTGKDVTINFDLILNKKQ